MENVLDMILLVIIMSGVAILAYAIGIIKTLYSIGAFPTRKGTKNKNNVHFYVARDNHACLGLFIGKPPIWKGMLESGNYILIGGYSCFPIVGLDTNDYANLKFGDEPVEVFLNMEK